MWKLFLWLSLVVEPGMPRFLEVEVQRMYEARNTKQRETREEGFYWCAPATFTTGWPWAMRRSPPRLQRASHRRTACLSRAPCFLPIALSVAQAHRAGDKGLSSWLPATCAMRLRWKSRG